MSHLVKPPIPLAFYFDGADDHIKVVNVPVNTEPGSYNTICFWMYWYGTLNQMPFGWNLAYDLWISSYNNFGFNTGGGDVYGIPNAQQKLANKWVYICAIFPNEYPTYEPSLYINAEKQTLSLLQGSRNKRSCTTTLYISGWGVNTAYKFGGLISDFRAYNRVLTDVEINELYNIRRDIKDGLILKLGIVGLVRGGGTQWLDESGYGNHGTVYGAIRVRCCHCNPVVRYGTATPI